MQLDSIRPHATDRPLRPQADVGATFDAFAPAFMSQAGIVSVGYVRTRPDEISLSAQNPELALLADRVLVDAVDGVRIVITSRTGGEVPADSWVRNPTNVARAMASLPGVVDWSRFGGYTLLAESRERAEWLRRIVSADIDGTPVRIMLREDLP